MSRTVLLVEPDVDVLGHLASRLRASGLTVNIADNPKGAVERARSVRPDAILVAEALVNDGEVLRRLDAERMLEAVPRFTLCSAKATLHDNELSYDDPEEMARRLFALVPIGPSIVPTLEDFRGDLRQVSMPDLLQLLSMNKRTGTLSINTSHGAGEVRVADGEIVDAVFRRLEGEKALYRLFAETEGGFAFVTKSAPAHRRIRVATHALLMEGMRQVDEVRRKAESLARADDALLAISTLPQHADEIAPRIAELLAAPRTLEELLDDLPYGDVEILDTLKGLLDSGVVRVLDRGAVQVELAGRERFAVLSALVKRLKRDGYSGAARVALFAPPRKVSALTHSVRRIADAVVPTGAVPSAPVPHTLAILRLSEGVELEVMGIPAIDSYQPLWALALPGCSLVVVLADAPTESVQELCGVFGIPVFESSALLGDFDEADANQVAALLSGALEAATGG